MPTHECPVGSSEAAASECPLCVQSLQAADRKLRDVIPRDPAVVFTEKYADEDLR